MEINVLQKIPINSKVSGTRIGSGEVFSGDFIGYFIRDHEDPDSLIASIRDDKERKVFFANPCNIKILSLPSEDDRIRNEILAYVGSKTDIDLETHNRWCAWLEKQKELPTNEEMLRTLRAEYEKGVADTIAKYEQKEQKSNSYKENGYYPIEDCDYGLEIAFDILEKTFGEVRGYQTDDGIREHQTAIEAVKKAKEQKIAACAETEPNADENTQAKGVITGVNGVPCTSENQSVDWAGYEKWSEEDETRLTNILIMLQEYVIHHYSKDDVNKSVDWLKSLPERFNLQPKQEWSEEDEETLKKLHRLLVICRGEMKFIQEADYNKMDNLLKSIRPQKLDASKLENFDPVDVLNRIKTEWPMAWEKVVGKQEWSEEDANTISYACYYLNEYGNHIADVSVDKSNRVYKTADALKSLRPQPKRNCKDCAMFLNGECTKPRWKPNEEQMKALLRAEGALRYIGATQDATVIAKFYEKFKKHTDGSTG